MKSVFRISIGAVALLASACGGDPSGESGANPGDGFTPAHEVGDSELSDVGTEGPQLDEAARVELEGQLNVYAQALVDRDVEQMDRLLSQEVKNRVAEKGADVGGFIDKMSKSMLGQFDDMTMGMGMDAPFTIIAAREEGDSVRAEVAYRGEAVGKPFYFVKEDGEFKINVRPAGFTRPLPDGSGPSTSSYLVNNVNEPKTIYCDNNRSKFFNVGQANITCDDTCGWWDGTGFWRPGGGWIDCDWNTWGIDVTYSAYLPGGAQCNDPC